MIFRFNQQTEKYLCERCRKPLGNRQFDCPRRHADGDENCAYQVEVGRTTKSGSLLLVLGGVVFGLGLWLLGADPQASTGKLIFAAIGLLLFLIGIYRIWGRYQIGGNPVTGQTWQRTTLFGIELAWVWQSGFQRVGWAGSPARVIRYPASVAEFCRQGTAVDIVSTALLQLFAQGILSLGKQITQRRYLRQQIRYLVFTGDAIEHEDPLGELESRLVEIVSTTALKGLPLADILDALFEGGHPQPRNFLIDRYIGPEAAALGLGKVIGVRQRALAPALNATAKMGRDIQSVEQLYRDLWITSPKEATDLLFQMDRYIVRLMRGRVSSEIPSR